MDISPVPTSVLGEHPPQRPAKRRHSTLMLWVMLAAAITVVLSAIAAAVTLLSSPQRMQAAAVSATPSRTDVFLANGYGAGQRAVRFAAGQGGLSFLGSTVDHSRLAIAGQGTQDTAPVLRIWDTGRKQAVATWPASTCSSVTPRGVVYCASQQRGRSVITAVELTTTKVLYTTPVATQPTTLTYYGTDSQQQDIIGESATATFYAAAGNLRTITSGDFQNPNATCIIAGGSKLLCRRNTEKDHGAKPSQKSPSKRATSRTTTGVVITNERQASTETQSTTVITVYDIASGTREVQRTATSSNVTLANDGWLEGTAGSNTVQSSGQETFESYGIDGKPRGRSTVNSAYKLSPAASSFTNPAGTTAPTYPREALTTDMPRVVVDGQGREFLRIASQNTQDFALSHATYSRTSGGTLTLADGGNIVSASLDGSLLLTSNLHSAGIQASGSKGLKIVKVADGTTLLTIKATDMRSLTIRSNLIASTGKDGTLVVYVPGK